MGRRSLLAPAILAAGVTAVSVGCANAQQFQAVFSGFNEVGALNAETGAILSTGQAKVNLTLNTQLQSLNYTLTYSGLGAPEVSSGGAGVEAGAPPEARSSNAFRDAMASFSL